MSYKPESYSSVSPYLVVPNAKDALEFLKHTFDAQEIQRFLRKNGSVMHYEVRIDDTILMIGDPGENWPAYAAHLHVYVKDAEAAFERALENGGTAVLEPFSHEEGSDVKCAVLDPGGNTWWITTKVSTAH